MDSFFARTKRALAGVLAAVMIITSLPTTMAYADETEEIGGEEAAYEVVSNRKIHISDENDFIGGFSYVEISISDNDKYNIVGEDKTVELKGGQKETDLEVRNGLAIGITGIDYSPSVYGQCAVIESLAYYEDGVHVADLSENDEGMFVTPRITRDCSIDFDVNYSILNVKDVKIAESTREYLDAENPISFNNECVLPDPDGEYYVVRGDFYFSLNPAKGQRVSRVLYYIGDTYCQFAEYDEESGKYVIPLMDVIKAIRSNKGILIAPAFADVQSTIVIVEDAKGRLKDGEDPRVLTDIELLNSRWVSGNEFEVPGGKIAFEYDYGYGLSDHEVVLKTPTAKIGYGTNAIELDVTYNDWDELWYVTGPMDEIREAAFNGDTIRICGAAEVIPQADVTLNIKSAHIKTITVVEGKMVDGKWVEVETNYFDGAKDIWTPCNKTVTVRVQKGNSVRVGYTYLDTQMNDTVFIAFEEKDSFLNSVSYPIFNKNIPEIRAYKDREYDIKTAFIGADNFKAKSTALKDESDISPNELEVYTTVSQVAYYMGYGIGHDCEEKVTIELYLRDLEDTELKHTYAFTGKFTCYAGKTEIPNVEAGEIYNNGTRATVIIPYGFLAMAAFSEEDVKLSIVAEVKETGYNTKRLTVIEEENNSTLTRIKSDGKLLYNTYMNQYDPDLNDHDTVYAKYGKKAEITVTPEEGYALEKTFLISRKDYEKKYAELEEKYEKLYPSTDSGEKNIKQKNTYDIHEEIIKWLLSEGNSEEKAKYGVKEYAPNSQGIITFSVDKVETSYYIINATDPLYRLDVDGEIVENNAVIDVPYNKETYISLLRGDRSAYLGSDWTVRRYYEGVPDVTANVIYKGSDYIELYAGKEGGEEAYGKTVILEIESKDDPKNSFKLSFNVSKPTTRDDVTFPHVGGYLIYELGTTYTLPVTVSDEFKKTVGPDQLGVCLTISGNDVVRSSAVDTKILVDEETKDISVEISSTVSGKKVGDLRELIDEEYYYLTLYDVNDTKMNPIDTFRIDFTDEDVVNADLTDIDIKAGPDSFTFDFTKLSRDGGFDSFEKETDGLYYLIEVNAENYKGKQLVSHTAKIVKATEDSYKLELAASSEYSFEPDAIEYNVSVSLVQVTELSKYGDYDSYYLVCGSKELKRTLSTVPDGKFATKVKVVMENEPKTLYSTMGKIKIAHVEYNDNKADEKLVTRLKKVELQDANGVVILETETYDGKALTFEAETYDGKALTFEGNDIYLDIAKFGGLGKYSIVAYSVQPRGTDVYGMTSINIKQGIEAIEFTMPRTVYKKNNAAVSVKASGLTCYPIADKKNKAPKKVTWSLVDSFKTSYDHFSETVIYIPGEEITVSGVSINKSGKISIKKNCVIPDEGLKLYVCAKANDYEGHDCTYVRQVTILNYNLVPKKIFIGGAELVNKGNYYSSQIYGVLECVDEDGTNVDATYKVNSALSKSNYFGMTNLIALAAKKIGNNATVTATSTDGSKKSLKVKFNVISDENLTFELRDPDERVIKKETDADGNYVFSNDRASGNSLLLTVYGDNKSLIKHSIKVTGGSKKVTSAGAYSYGTYGTVYKITPNKGTTTITLTETKTKKATVIKITNTLLTSTKKAAISGSNKYVASVDYKKNSVKEGDLKGNILPRLYFNDNEEYEDAGSINKVTYTVTLDKKPAKGKVLIDVGNSDVLAKILSFNTDDPKGSTGIGPFRPFPGPDPDPEPKTRQFIFALDSEGKFAIDYAYGCHVDGISKDICMFSVPEGKYSFTLTVLDEEGKVVSAPTTYTFKTTKAPKASVKCSTNLNNFESAGTVGFASVSNVVINRYENPQYWGCLSYSDKGSINKFSEVFTLNSLYNLNGRREYIFLCQKTPKGFDKAYTAKPSAGITGYLRYSYTTLDGIEKFADLKVTVKPAPKGEIIMDEYYLGE